MLLLASTTSSQAALSFWGSVYDHMTAEQTNTAEPPCPNPAASKPPWSDLLIIIVGTMNRMHHRNILSTITSSLLILVIKAELNLACLEKWNWQSADLCALMRLVVLMQAKQNCSVTVLKGLKPRPYFSVFCLRARSTVKSCCWRHIGAPLGFLFSVSSPSLCSNSDESSLLVQYHQDRLIKFISCDLFCKSKKNNFLSHNNFSCLNSWFC